MKSILSVITILTLIISNILTLSNVGTHDFLYGMLNKLPFPDLTTHSPTKRHSRLIKENALYKKNVKALKLKNTRLVKENVLHKKNVKILNFKNTRLLQNSYQVKRLSNRISARLFRNVSRNIASIPAESLPYLGAGVTLAVTALDVKDACDTMHDMNVMLSVLEVPANDDTVKICAIKLPGIQ